MLTAEQLGVDKRPKKGRDKAPPNVSQTQLRLGVAATERVRALDRHDEITSPTGKIDALDAAPGQSDFDISGTSPEHDISLGTSEMILIDPTGTKIQTETISVQPLPQLSSSSLPAAIKYSFSLLGAVLRRRSIRDGVALLIEHEQHQLDEALGALGRVAQNADVAWPGAVNEQREVKQQTEEIAEAQVGKKAAEEKLGGLRAEAQARKSALVEKQSALSTELSRTQHELQKTVRDRNGLIRDERRAWQQLALAKRRPAIKPSELSAIRTDLQKKMRACEAPLGLLRAQAAYLQAAIGQVRNELLLAQKEAQSASSELEAVLRRFDLAYQSAKRQETHLYLHGGTLLQLDRNASPALAENFRAIDEQKAKMARLEAAAQELGRFEIDRSAIKKTAIVLGSALLLLIGLVVTLCLVL